MCISSIYQLKYLKEPYTLLDSAYEKLKKETAALEQRLAAFPESNLRLSRNRNHYNWLEIVNHTKQYIPRTEKAYAQKLALKEYLSAQLEDKLLEMHAIEKYLKCFPDEGLTNTDRLLQYLEPSGLLPSLPEKSSDIERKWLAETYPPLNFHPEELKFKTPSGYVVRSKSEQMIAMALYQHGIAFKYECPVCLNGKTLFPDFTIMRPLNHSIVYWEHFGKMDDDDYLKRNRNKIPSYWDNGIIPGKNLIVTFETLEQPLDISYVTEIIDHFIL